MSRQYKDMLVDDFLDLGGTGIAVADANAEKLSGADLMQMLNARRAGSTVSSDAAGTKSLGTNAAYAGTPNNAALSGADVIQYAGTN
jgi:hypothetical protein